MGGQLLLLNGLMVITACFQSLCVSMNQTSRLAALVLETEMFQLQAKCCLFDLIFSHLRNCACVFFLCNLLTFYGCHSVYSFNKRFSFSFSQLNFQASI